MDKMGMAAAPCGDQGCLYVAGNLFLSPWSGLVPVAIFLLQVRAQAEEITLHWEVGGRRGDVRLGRWWWRTHEQLRGAWILLELAHHDMFVYKKILERGCLRWETTYPEGKCCCQTFESSPGLLLLLMNAVQVVHLCMGSMVGMARKKYGISYPSLYAVPGSKGDYSPKDGVTEESALKSSSPVKSQPCPRRTRWKRVARM